MTAIQTEYQFTAKITGKAETPGGTPYLQFDWKLPGDQYAFQLLLGQEKDVYEAWNPGQIATVVVGQGPLKTGKNGAYARDYHWNVESISGGERVDTMPEPDHEPTPGQSIAAQANQPAPERPLTEAPGHPTVYAPSSNLVPPVEGVVRGHVENIAVRLYLNIYQLDGVSEIDFGDIRQLRDRVYHQLTNQPIQPLGYCYRCEVACVESRTGKYGHQLPDGTWCVEGENAPETNGEPTQEGK